MELNLKRMHWKEEGGENEVTKSPGKAVEHTPELF